MALTTSQPSIPSTSKSGCNNEENKRQKTSSDGDCDIGSLLPSCPAQINSKLTTRSLLSDRYKVSDRACTAIATGVLYDLELISDVNIEKVIDRNKIKREKARTREAITEEDQVKAANAIYFDRTKDNILTQENI